MKLESSSTPSPSTTRTGILEESNSYSPDYYCLLQAAARAGGGGGREDYSPSLLERRRSVPKSCSRWGTGGTAVDEDEVVEGEEWNKDGRRGDPAPKASNLRRNARRTSYSCKYPSTTRPPRGSVSINLGGGSGSGIGNGGGRRESTCMGRGGGGSGTRSMSGVRGGVTGYSNGCSDYSPNAQTSALRRVQSMKAESNTSGNNRCVSAPQSRSSSWKRKRHQRNTCARYPDEEDDDDDEGLRSGSWRPAPGGGSGETSFEETVSAKLHELKLLQDDDCCVVRSFVTSSKGRLINRGDSFKRKTESGLASVTGVIMPPLISSSTSSATPIRYDQENDNLNVVLPVTGPRGLAPGTEVDLSADPSSFSPPSAARPSYTVLVMGDHGVGKTALLQQFMTSDFMAAIETNFDAECEKTVSVVLDGQETTLNFVDLPVSVQKECVQYGEIEAYLVTYSITDRASFDYANDILRELVDRGRTSDAAVIVVSNKNDLVRARQVTDEEGRALCQSVGCKYVEVSAALAHRVDDLLAGLVHQISLNPRRTGAAASTNGPAANTGGSSAEGNATALARLRGCKRAGSTRNAMTRGSWTANRGCFDGAKAFFADLLRVRRDTPHSCDNLWVL